MRFSLFPGSKTSNPILAFCNSASRVFFFDLERLRHYWEQVETLPENPFTGRELKGKAAKEKKNTGLDLANAAISFASNSSGSASAPTDNHSHKRSFLVPVQRRTRGRGASTGGGAVARLTRAGSPTESASSHQTGSDGHDERSRSRAGEAEPATSKVNWGKSHEKWLGQYYMGNALAQLKAHHTEVVKGVAFTGRHVGWSIDGEWCVVVGSAGVWALLQRSKK